MAVCPDREELRALSRHCHVRFFALWLEFKQIDISFRAHGLSGNKTMGLKQYAEIYVQMGYACVLFDYRRWGASGMTFLPCAKMC